MNAQYLGFLIRKERLARGWSQESLCRGICAVSYLSKIEQGKTEAGIEILKLLLEKMDIQYHTDDDGTAQELFKQFYDAVFSYVPDEWMVEMREAFTAQADRLLHGPFALDALLMQAYFAREPMDSTLESYLDRRQLTLQRILQERFDEALMFNPCALTHMAKGYGAYESGANLIAIEHLQAGYDLAAESGMVYIMLACQASMGGCYSTLQNYTQMRVHYAIAERLAQAVGADEVLKGLKYNTAVTAMEVGNYEQAYQYFSKQDPEKADALTLHKAAICYEKMGKRKKALAALDQAQTAEISTPGRELTDQMCDVVRYRLEHPDYLRHEAYGSLLLDCFEKMRKTLRIGYARFHLPWVLEWYTAKRQYKQAYEISLDFPLYHE